MSTLRITVLVENTARKAGLLAEHGLALWIETGGKNILFDSGQSRRVLLNNARTLNIELEKADAVVISHGHYDHTGGLEHMLNIAPKAQFFAHPDIFEAKYTRQPDGRGRKISIPMSKKAIEQQRSRFTLSEESTDVCGGLRLSGYIPRLTDFEDTGGAFFTDAECSKADNINDDQSAFIETPEGIVVISDCAHAGIINTLRHISKLSGKSSIHTLIGGTHLINADSQRIAKTVAQLRAFGPRLLAPLHCTGLAATCVLRNEFPEAFKECNTGSVIEI